MKTKLDKWLEFTHIIHETIWLILISFKTLLNQNSNVGTLEVKECTTLNSCWTCKNQHLIVGLYHTVMLTTLMVHGVRHCSLLASVNVTHNETNKYWWRCFPLRTDQRWGAVALGRAGAKLCTRYAAPRTSHRELRGPYQSRHHPTWSWHGP
jgi:hypothetical protein